MFSLTEFIFSFVFDAIAALLTSSTGLCILTVGSLIAWWFVGGA